MPHPVPGGLGIRPDPDTRSRSRPHSHRAGPGSSSRPTAISRDSIIYIIVFLRPKLQQSAPIGDLTLDLELMSRGTQELSYRLDWEVEIPEICTDFHF